MMNKPLKLPENGFEVLASDGGGKITFERLTISPENMKTLQRENERLKGAVQEWVDGVCISQKHLSQIGILQQENERYKAEKGKIGKWPVEIGTLFMGLKIVGADYRRRTIEIEWKEKEGE